MPGQRRAALALLAAALALQLLGRADALRESAPPRIPRAPPRADALRHAHGRGSTSGGAGHNAIRTPPDPEPPATQSAKPARLSHHTRLQQRQFARRAAGIRFQRVRTSQRQRFAGGVRGWGGG